MMSLQTTEFFATVFDEENTKMEYEVTTIPSSPQPEYRIATLLAAIIMCTISVIGLIGNSSVLFIILKYKEMQNITNYFIANLAITDIAMLTICAIPTLLFSNAVIPLTPIICKTVQYMQFVSIYQFLYHSITKKMVINFFFCSSRHFGRINHYNKTKY